MKKLDEVERSYHWKFLKKFLCQRMLKKELTAKARFHTGIFWRTTKYEILLSAIFSDKKKLIFRNYHQNHEIIAQGITSLFLLAIFFYLFDGSYWFHYRSNINAMIFLRLHLHIKIKIRIKDNSWNVRISTTMLDMFVKFCE